MPIESFSVDFGYKVRTDFEGGNPAGFLEKVERIIPFIQAVGQSNPFAVKADVMLNQVLRRVFKTSMPLFTNTPEEQQALQEQKIASEQAVNAQVGANAPQPNEK